MDMARRHGIFNTGSSASFDHPPETSGPTDHEDHSENPCTCSVTGSEIVEARHSVGGIGASGRIADRFATIVGSERWTAVKVEHGGVESSQNRKFLLQTWIIESLRVPVDATLSAIGPTGASLRSGRGGSLQPGHHELQSVGDNGSHERQPSRIVSFEGDLVAITLVDGFAGDLGEDGPAISIKSLGRIEFTRGSAVEAFDTIFPLLVPVGLDETLVVRDKHRCVGIDVRSCTCRRHR